MGLIKFEKGKKIKGKTMVLGATGAIGSVCCRLLAKAFDEGIDSVEGEISENIKETGGPSAGKPLMENANMVASIVEDVKENVTGLTKSLLGDEDEESKDWKDDDLADW